MVWSGEENGTVEYGICYSYLWYALSMFYTDGKPITNEYQLPPNHWLESHNHMFPYDEWYLPTGTWKSEGVIRKWQDIILSSLNLLWWLITRDPISDEPWRWQEGGWYSHTPHTDTPVSRSLMIYKMEPAMPGPLTATNNIGDKNTATMILATMWFAMPQLAEIYLITALVVINVD